MKPSLLAASLLAAVSGMASAQTTVTLAGVVDASLRSVKNSLGTVRSLSSGNNSSSRLGFRGSEDLGGGWRAGFWLESSFNLDTGAQAGAQFWDRQATVSLSGPLGEVRMGRDWTPVYFGYLLADPWINVGVASGSNFLSATAATTYQRAFANPGLTTLSRANNAVEYWLPPNLGGLYGNVMIAPGEAANATGGFKYSAGRLGYRSTTLDVSAYGGSTQVDATGSKLKQVGVFGSCAFGPVTAMVSVTHSDYRESKHSHLMAGLRANLGSWIVKASYNRLDQRGVDAAGKSIDANDASQFGLGADYLLSKRTAIYATAAHLSNKGAARFSIPLFVPVAPGSSTTGYDLGLRHTF